MRLLRGETVTDETDWFTLQDARLQLPPYSDPCFDIAVAASFSPTGARAAASTASACSRSRRPRGRAWTCSPTTGDVGRGRAEHGHAADRSKWRLVGPMHLAETHEQAERDVEYGIVEFSRYFTHVLPAGPVQGDTAAEIIENNREYGFAVIGTPDDAVAKIQELVEASTAASARSCSSTTTGRPRPRSCGPTSSSRST